MKINCGETQKEKFSRLEQWHYWFAWYPVRLGSRDCRWLETIERKGKYYGGYSDIGWVWEYRAK